ncbi:transposase [uncultured Methylibium sp.]|uniref:transposase n=1 Tax=uncultured Methylibium sp. TaxID=381093 RepID=UPI0025FD7659|nr:transposase [uncultured Methylibium sp.]
MNTYGVDLMGRRRRRRHSAEFKATVIEECLRPGVSITAAALAHSLNANVLSKWVTDAEHKEPVLHPRVAKPLALIEATTVPRTWRTARALSPPSSFATLGYVPQAAKSLSGPDSALACDLSAGAVVPAPATL